MKASEKLAQSLDILRRLQKAGHYPIQSKNISRTHRERLLASGIFRRGSKGVVYCR